MNTKKPLVYLFLLVTSLMLAQTPKESVNYKNIINISGKQRMLTQKMTKAFLLQVKDIKGSKVENELNFSKIIFEKQLSILKKDPTSAVTKANLDKVDVLWADFKSSITKGISNENALNLVKTNTALLKACNSVVTVIEAEAQKNASADANLKALASIINISGKQRMLSQRMCLYFMASKNYPEQQAEFKGVLKNVFEQFSGAIQTLSASTLNNTAIKSELSAVVNIWSNYKANKAQILEVREDVEKMYALTNDLTKRFDKITTLYELSGTENQ